jgi:5-methylcytosine-specific restriction endonuclease McrA
MSRPNYRTYLKSPEWQAKRAACIERAGGKCQLCGKPSDRLHAHHNTYAQLGSERDADLIALCRECHQRYHKSRKGKHDLHFSKQAKRVIRLCNLEKQTVMLTRSEMERRRQRALRFLATGR